MLFSLEITLGNYLLFIIFDQFYSIMQQERLSAIHNIYHKVP